MYMEWSQKNLRRLVSAGTLLTVLGLSGLTTAYGQGNEWGGVLRRNRNPAYGSQAQRTARDADDDDDDDIQQVLEEDTPATPAPPPDGAKVQPEGDGPPAGTDPAAPAADAPPAPWGLTDIFDDGCGANVLKDNQWKIGGNIAQSFTGNFSSPRDRFNGPVTWEDRSNEYELNQFWLYFERATDTSKKDWDLGGRFDAFLGTNARFDTETGLENNNFSFNSRHSIYGIALPQFYVETAYKSLKIKWGHFISPVGYFTVDTTQNFFNTLPYTFQYGEPFTHTGAVATWVANEKWTLGGGIVRGWDNFDASGTGTSHLAAIGQVTRTWEDKSSFYYFGIWSDEANGFGTDTSSRYLQTLVYSKPLNDKWTYVAQSDLGIQENTNNAVGGGTSRWYGLNQYLYYVQNEKWTWGLNGEWFRDEEGFRVGGFLPVPPGSANPSSSNFVATRGLSTGRVGYVGNFYQTTMGPKWQFHKNMFLRPNLRFDYFDGTANNTGNLLPFGDGNKHWQGIIATDLCIVF
jgi:hypothetical protein